MNFRPLTQQELDDDFGGTAGEGAQVAMVNNFTTVLLCRHQLVVLFEVPDGAGGIETLEYLLDVRRMTVKGANKILEDALIGQNQKQAINMLGEYGFIHLVY